MEFLQTTLMLSVYDVVRFPAYFSYPLDKVIEPRVVFLEVSVWRERPSACCVRARPFLCPIAT